MTSLFALTTEYRDAVEKLADLDLPPEVVADTLEGLSGELEVKAQNVAMFARKLESEASAMKEWAKAATERAKATEARAEALRGYLANCMDAAGLLKIEGPGVKLSFRKSSAVVIDGADLIPAEFMRIPEPPPPAPDKKAISDAIKAGKEVPGCHLEHRKSLQIS